MSKSDIFICCHHLCREQSEDKGTSYRSGWVPSSCSWWSLKSLSWLSWLCHNFLYCLIILDKIFLFLIRSALSPPQRSRRTAGETGPRQNSRRLMWVACSSVRKAVPLVIFPIRHCCAGSFSLWNVPPVSGPRKGGKIGDRTACWPVPGMEESKGPVLLTQAWVSENRSLWLRVWSSPGRSSASAAENPAVRRVVGFL